MSFSPAGSNTPFSDYTTRSVRGGLSLLTATDGDGDTLGLNSGIIEVYVLKNTSDPVLVLVPVARAETYSAFWGVIRNDLYPSSSLLASGQGGEEDDDDDDEVEVEKVIPPMIFLLDPFMTRLRLELWSDLLSSLRGKRLLVLPGDATAPPPLLAAAPAAAAARPLMIMGDEASAANKPFIPQYLKSTWTNLMPKSTPIMAETSLVTVDAQPSSSSSEPADNRMTWVRRTPTPTPTPTPDASAERKGRPKLKAEDRSLSFFKTPEFAFDVSLWCRFAPSYKPSLLMHFQFREIVVQVVPSAKGLSVRNLTSKISSAVTNMLRRQGCLGTLTSSPMEDFRDLLVKAEFLRFALEDWPSSRESLGLTWETLRWIQEPLLLYCEIMDVHFPQKLEKVGGENSGERAGERAGGRARSERGSERRGSERRGERRGRKQARRVEIESASEEEVE